MTGDELIAWRKRHKLTQPQAAECFGMSLRGWQKREAGNVPVNRETELACRFIDLNPRAAFPGSPLNASQDANASQAANSEVEALRLELIAERGDSEAALQADNAPGSFGCHEAFHMASVFSATVDRELLDHGAILARPEWFALANRAFDALFALYQAIGAEHPEAVENTPDAE